MIKTLTVAQCPLCQSPKSHLILRVRGQQVLCCDHCAFVYGDRVLADPTVFYATDYFTESTQNLGYADYEGGFDSNTLTFAHRLSAVDKRLGRRGVLLDYGCAYGHLGLEAKRQGWQVIGADISVAAVKHAKQKYGLHGIVADLQNPPFRPKRFDMIALYDVIEHVSEPLKVFEALGPLLKADGLLHLSTPDHGSLSARLMGPHWYHYKPLEHVMYFDRHSIRQALERSGWLVDHISSSTSYMSLGDVVERLKFYEPRFFKLVSSMITATGLSKLNLAIKVGELEAWASRPALGLQKVLDIGCADDDLLAFVHCPDCQGDLHWKHESAIGCDQCDAALPVVDGVPILLPSSSDSNEEHIHRYGQGRSCG